jgi:hypothetical protein
LGQNTTEGGGGGGGGGEEEKKKSDVYIQQFLPCPTYMNGCKR